MTTPTPEPTLEAIRSAETALQQMREQFLRARGWVLSRETLWWSKGPHGPLYDVDAIEVEARAQASGRPPREAQEETFEPFDDTDLADLLYPHLRSKS